MHFDKSIRIQDVTVFEPLRTGESIRQMRCDDGTGKQ